MVEARKLEAMGARIRNLETDVRSKRSSSCCSTRATPTWPRRRPQRRARQAAREIPVALRRTGPSTSDAWASLPRRPRTRRRSTGRSKSLALRDQLQRQQADAAAAVAGGLQRVGARRKPDPMQANAKLRRVALLQEKLAEAEGAM